MLRKAILFLCIHALAASAFSQQKDEIVLPIEINTTPKGIEVKITILSIKLSEEGAYADMILAFKNPQTGEWIIFEAEDAQISLGHGLIYSFMLKLQERFKKYDIDFTKAFLEQKGKEGFIWKCHCDDILLPLF